MAQSLDLEIPNSNDGLLQATSEAAVFLEQQSLSPATEYAINLALEEMVTNVIKYAYDDELPHQIGISVCIGDSEAVMTLTDDGHEFNPLAAPEPDLDQDIEDRPIGGLGLHLVQSMAKRVEYERRQGRNLLTLTYASHG
jgi:anti-sigma regulatory factor (Ser/Thr protein kinase)